MQLPSAAAAQVPSLYFDHSSSIHRSAFWHAQNCSHSNNHSSSSQLNLLQLRNQVKHHLCPQGVFCRESILCM